MTFNEFVFYLFAAILIFAALRVITARNPVHAALFLVLAFATSAVSGVVGCTAGCEAKPSCSAGRVVGSGGLGAGDVL